jgi:DNA mismatch repair protein MutL
MNWPHACSKSKKQTHHGVTVSGYIGGPRHEPLEPPDADTYLNGRPIESRQHLLWPARRLSHGVDEGQHPVTFLFIQMDAHAFDVNVHPAKKEVRFHDGNGVRDAIARA